MNTVAGPSRQLLISCEHASNHVPPQWRDVLDPADPALFTHEGYDIGAADLATALHKRLGGALIMADQTRLLIDLNRSPHNYRRYSRYTRGLCSTRKRTLQSTFHDSYWNAITDVISNSSELFHLSIHSFTGEFNGAIRKTDIGLLPLTTAEDVSNLAHHWKPVLARTFPGLSVHINQPYTGNQDGLIRQMMLRRKDSRYLGLEIEVNQDVIVERRQTLADGIAATLPELIALQPAA